jgi:hypothetical protein
MGMHTSAHPAKVFANDQVKLATLNALDRLKGFCPIKALATSLARDDFQIVGEFRGSIQPPPIKGLLVIKTLLVLIDSADAANCQDF